MVREEWYGDTARKRPSTSNAEEGRSEPQPCWEMIEPPGKVLCPLGLVLCPLGLVKVLCPLGLQNCKPFVNPQIDVWHKIDSRAHCRFCVGVQASAAFFAFSAQVPNGCTPRRLRETSLLTPRVTIER